MTRIGEKHPRLSAPIRGKRGLPVRQAHLIQPHGIRRPDEVGVRLISNINAAVAIGGMRHAQVDRLPLAIHGYSGKDHVASGLALKLPDQMHPGFGGRFSARGGRAYPLEADRVPDAPGVRAGKIALRGKIIATAIGALGYVELQRLRR
jgi:hypothetical protein